MWRSGDCRKLAGDHTRCGGFDRKLLYWRKLNYHSCVDRQIIAPDNVTVTERRERPRHEEQLKKNPKNIQPNAAASAHFCLLSLSLSPSFSLSSFLLYWSLPETERWALLWEPFGASQKSLSASFPTARINPGSSRRPAPPTEQAPHHGGRLSPKTPRPTIIL